MIINLINFFILLHEIQNSNRCLLLDKLCENNLLAKGEYNFLINSWKNGLNYDFKCFDGIPKTFSDEDDRVNAADNVITPLLSNIDGFVNIVTETFHQHYSGIYFSEKTLYPIFYKRPFLVFSVPNFYKKFVECGFKLYDEIFDYSFDTENDVSKKCELIVENIKRLEGKDLNKLYKSLYKKIEFNQKRLLDILNNNSYQSIEMKEHTGLYNKNLKL